jgi:hypothetical protein
VINFEGQTFWHEVRIGNLTPEGGESFEGQVYFEGQ